MLPSRAERSVTPRSSVLAPLAVTLGALALVLTGCTATNGDAKSAELSLPEVIATVASDVGARCADPTVTPEGTSVDEPTLVLVDGFSAPGVREHLREESTESALIWSDEVSWVNMNEVHDAISDQSPIPVRESGTPNRTNFAEILAGTAQTPGLLGYYAQSREYHSFTVTCQNEPGKTYPVSYATWGTDDLGIIDCALTLPATASAPAQQAAREYCVAS
ncbi:hypothetical protein D9V32_04520 [Mycetocola tolaasinivorans]|uniref:Uncharacterized protein n=1 Tax=Mycetocola tolaasinivorans TaxID=76635 RepID=A0A3L7A983_9MICO|nr:hypothetical protein [Mycetocola tolaasinivorans]RLP76899.1 hypothetical protein D9V32_04520 [Mycetocola tolaasinivorans]